MTSVTQLIQQDASVTSSDVPLFYRRGLLRREQYKYCATDFLTVNLKLFPYGCLRLGDLPHLRLVNLF